MTTTPNTNRETAKDGARGTTTGRTRPVRTFLTTTWRWAVFAMAGALATPRNLAAQNPWEDAVNALMTAMTGPIARGLSLVAIVIGGLMFAFGEGGSKRTLAGIIFGLGMAMGAANFLTWLF